MALGRKIGLNPSDIVLDGDPAPPKRVQSPQFLAHACCRQTAAWIKMPLGMEIGLGPDDFVSDGDPPEPLPNFRPFFIGAKRLDGSR